VSEPPLAVRVRSEIWESFVSLLASYAAATGPHYRVRKLHDGAAVELGDHAIRFRFDPLDGKAVWREVTPAGESCGHFQVLEDGDLEIAGNKQPMDLAAIDWIANLKNQPLRECSEAKTNLE
jgi:hypothetical protein